MYRLFTSESVSGGHPDKIADQISDYILDKIIEKDKNAHVACETFVTKNLVVVGGEIKTEASVNIEKSVRDIINRIGYNRDVLGFNGKNCKIINVIGKQSEDIYNSIKKGRKKNAGDQGSVFGYAVNETTNLMPAPIFYAHALIRRYHEIRKDKNITWLFPDAKSQVTFLYKDNKPIKITSIVFSMHHSEDTNRKNIIDFVQEEIIKKCIPIHLIDKNTNYYINQSGRFCIGGPAGDCGLTGRKIIVDTYGGFSKHGGGAFSGKDPSKIDRSAAYMARYLCKNIVGNNLSKKCEIQISYVIGRPEPLSLTVNTYNSGKIKDDILSEIIKKNYDLSPQGIIDFLTLLRPIYTNTAFLGHFGRTEADFTWENVDSKNPFSNI